MRTAIKRPLLILLGVAMLLGLGQLPAEARTLTGEDPFTSQTGWGTLVTEAMLEDSGADLALLDANTVSSLTAETVRGELPEDPTFVPTEYRVVELAGEDLQGVLESAVKFLPRRNTSFLQLAGLRVTLEVSGSDYRLASTSLESDRDYRVAISGFLAGGGGCFREVDLSEKEMESFNLVKAVQQKLQGVSTLPDPAGVYTVAEE